MGKLMNDIISTAESYVKNFNKLGNLDYSILNNGVDDSITFYINGYKQHIEIGKNKKGYEVTLI